MMKVFREATKCLVAAAALLALVPCAPAHGLTFSDSGQSLAFTNPIAGAVADFSGDGRADILVISTSNNEVWFGGASGTFTNSGQNLGAGNGAYAIRDFDGDGDLDLALGTLASGIKIWFNNGTGTFTNSGQTLGSGSAGQLAALDMDSDNDIDIFEGRSSAPSYIWLNNGKGTFTQSTTMLNKGSIASVRVGDFNADGFYDVAAADQTNINVYYGDGQGWFAGRSMSLISAPGETMCVDDYNTDSKPHIASMSTSGSNALFQTMSSPQSYVSKAMNFGGYESLGCASGDLDNDGDVDIMQTGSTGGYVRFWLNDGLMTFASHTQAIASGAALPIGITDVDGDGDSDVLFIIAAAGTGKVYFGDSAPAVTNAAPSAPTLTPVGSPTSRRPAMTWSAPADDHTQSPAISYDVRIATQSGKYNVFSGLHEEGAGHVRGTSFNPGILTDGTYYWSARAVDTAGAKSSWAAEDTFSVSFSFIEKPGPVKATGASQTVQFTIADFDADGAVDILSSSAETTFRKLYKNDGSGKFTESGAVTSMYSKAADIDNDGDLDIVNNDSVYVNDGAGSFTSTGQTISAGNMCLADVDRDGDIDIISGQTDKLYLNNGAGVFTRSGQNSFYTSVYVRCADMDLDGDVDAVVYTTADNSLAVWMNNGEGWFGTSPAQNIIPATTWEDFTLSDYDGDGDMDVLPTADNILANTGGTLADTGVSIFSGFSDSIAQGDVDNNGAPDAFMTAKGVGLSGLLWKNSGAGTFSTLGETFTQVGYSNGVIIADVNGDKYNDIVTSGGSIYFNDMYNGPGGNAPANTAPSVPALTHHADSATSTVTFAWAQSTDAQTPAAAITYNVRAGTTPGAGNVYSGAAPVGPGKDGSLESITLRRLPNATIYWSVQAVDSGFATSEWAADDSFVVNVPFAFTDGGQSIGAADTGAIAAADFDGDGDIDFVEGNNGFSTVWTNSGAGAFTMGGLLGSATTKAVAAADFDGDGSVDVALGNTEASKIFLNNGSGTFTEKAQSFTADASLSLAAADLDRDGDVDLFSGNTGADKAALNDGNGSFTQATQTLGSLPTNDIALADFDRDGDIDAFTCETGGATMWLNDGYAWFTSSGQSFGSDTNKSCAAADVDRDGDLDIVTGTASGTKILLNNGAAVMTDSGQTLDSGNTVDVALADFDHDGDLDIFTAAAATSSKIWLNNGNGVFSDLGASYGGGTVSSAAAADIDGDKDVDIILGYAAGADKTLVSNVADLAGGNSPNSVPTAPILNVIADVSLFSTTLTWLPATDAVTPMSQLTYNVRMGTTPGGNDVISAAIAAGPGNAGQSLFRKIANLYPGTYYWAVQAMDGDNAKSAWSAEDSFNNVAPFRDTGQSFASAKTRAISAAAFNADTQPDAVTGVDGASKLWLNVGGGQLLDAGVSLGSAATIATFAADFDGDGDTDLVKAEYDGTAHTLFNGGSGAMTSSQTILLSGLNVFGVTGADFDMDGDTDLVFSTFGGDNKIFLNDGHGGFSSSSISIVSANSYCMFPFDVNRDGAPDLIDGTSDGVILWKNNKSGAFSTSLTTTGTGSALAVSAADFNGDGWPDVVRSNGAKILVYPNTGTGYITTDGSVQLTATGSVMALAAADIDLDGDFDIIAATNKGVKIFMNDGSMNFADSEQLLGPNDTRAIGVADFDGDTDLDIFAGNYNESARLWENLRVSSGSSVTANTAPSAPMPTDIATSTTNVILRWTGGTDTTTPAALMRYNVRVGKSPGASDAKPPPAQFGIYDTAATTALVVNLAPGTYYWAVRAVDSANMKSSWSAEDQFTVVPPDTTPPVFAGVTSAADTALGGTVDLSWATATDESPPITYLIYYALATATLNYNTPASTTSGLTARITGLVNNTGYKFAVRARDSKSNVNANLVVAYATPTYAGEIRPAAPENVAATVTGGSVSLTWSATTKNTDGSAITDLQGYNIYRDVQCGGTNTVMLNTSVATATAWTDAAVMPDSIYYYTVKAQNTKPVESAASQCAAASTYTKGIQGYVKKFDTSGGSIYPKGYTLLPVQGITFKLYDNTDVLAGSAVSDAAGYFFITVNGDTTGKTYMLIEEVTVESGYLATSGTFQSGVGKRAVATGLTITNSVQTVKVPNVGYGPAVGDSNCDWVVNLYDFTALKTVFSKKKGEAGYSINIDVNGDEAINLPDFMIQKQNFSLKGNPVTPSPCQ